MEFRNYFCTNEKIDSIINGDAELIESEIKHINNMELANYSSTLKLVLAFIVAIVGFSNSHIQKTIDIIKLATEKKEISDPIVKSNILQIINNINTMEVIVLAIILTLAYSIIANGIMDRCQKRRKEKLLQSISKKENQN